MKSRRYFQLVERESSEVSLKWKVLHTTLFIVIALNSTIASYAISNLLNAFKCRCILYAEPVFLINNIVFLNKTKALESVTEAMTETTTEVIIETTEDTTMTISIGVTTTKPLEPNRSSKEVGPAQFRNSDTEILFSTSKRDNNGTFKGTKNFNNLKRIPQTENCYLWNDSILFKNDSMYGEVNVKMAKTDSSYLLCDFVHFTPSFSLIVASVFTAIILIYGRGGRGYPADTVQQGWRHVYLIMMVSLLFCILFIVATNLTNNGTQQFCSYFSSFTGKDKCNNLIDYFTIRTKLNHVQFYADYLLAYYTYTINTCLWAAQLLLILWRMLSIADFQFNNILVKVKNLEVDGKVPTAEEEVDEKQFQKIHQVLKAKEIGTRVDPYTPDDDDDDGGEDGELDQNTESTARV